ncbi:tetratricopeptide repeat protein [Candidatus Fermentibacterales bacterium]|nr:tetratricopeptide repeat protein [Candidatus Fermentibacterales bacterium]
MSDYLASLIREDLEKLSEIVVDRAPASGKLLPGERRRVAILFLDLSGFTALSERLDHEVLHRLTGGLMKALARVVEAHGGYVDKFEGDRIMALFGARAAFENDCSRAVASGLRMLETIEEINGILQSCSPGGAPTRLSARVGISFGSVTVGPDPSGHLTAMGEEVSMASRLEETARVGTVQVASRVRRECGDLFEWLDLGDMAIDGISKPVRTFRPLGPGSVRRDRWERASRVARSPLVGRRRETLRLYELWDKQRAGVGRNRRGGAVHVLLEIVGDAGIGKSRLVEEFLDARSGEEAGISVLRGQAQSFAQPPYRVWTSLIKEHLGIGPADGDPVSRLCSWASGVPEDLDGSMPFLSALLSSDFEDQRLRQLDGEARHQETLAAIRDFVRAAAGNSPGRVVLVLEDLQWMDAASREALEFVLGNCDTARPILFLCLSRPADQEGWAGPAAIPPGYVRNRRIRLESLNEEYMATIAGYVLRPDSADSVDQYLPAGVGRFLLDRAQGNPFFLEELILHLLEMGILEPSDDGWRVDGCLEDVQVPASVSGIVCARLDGLPRELRATLQCASVLGPSFGERLFGAVSTVMELDQEPAQLARDLVSRGFLTDAGPDSGAFSFVHELVRESAYETMLVHNRKVIHSRTARVLEQDYPDFSAANPDVVAEHFLKAGDMDGAIRWGMAALSRCVSDYRNEEGLEWAARLQGWIVSSVTDRGEARELEFQALTSKLSILEVLGRTGEAGSVLERMEELAREQSSNLWMAWVMRHRASLLHLMGKVSEAAELVTRALATAREQGDVKLQMDCYQIMGRLHWLRGHFEEALESYAASRVLSDGSEDRTSGFAGQRVNIGSILIQQGRYEDAKRDYDEALDIYRDAGDRRGEARVLSSLGVLHGMKSDMGRALACMEEALRIYVEIGNRRGEGVVLGNLAVCRFEAGDVESALETARRSLDIHREIGNRKSQGVALNNVGDFSRTLGRSREAREAYEQALVIALEVGNPASEASVRSGMGLLELSEGEIELAAQHYERASSIAEELHLTESMLPRLRELGMRLLETGKVGEQRLSLPSAWEEE